LKIQNVQYINDSKATNVNATFFLHLTVWICQQYGLLEVLIKERLQWIDVFSEKVKAIVCLGVDNKK
jgi:UDP-N-acetylmuramoylalanine--D-glutamate ligase